MADRTELPAITDTLCDIRHGDLITDLTVALHDVVTAVRATGGKGVLTLKLTIQPFSKGDPNTLTVFDDVSTKLPRSESPATIMFSTDDGILSRQDPRQPELKDLHMPAEVMPFPKQATDN
jgi:hypothetical protein